MILRKVFFIIIIFIMAGFLANCVHSQKQKTLIFNDENTKQRVEYLQNNLKINPNDFESRMELGRLFLKENFNKEAINEFEHVINLDSNCIQAYLLLSYALQKPANPNLPRAAGLLEKAIQLAPDHADAHLNLAQVYDKLKKEQEAVTEFSKSIELSDDPATLVSAHLGLMAIYKKRGELEKANKEYEAAYKIYPGVEEMIKQAEINRIVPAPQYAGDEFRDGDDLHPSLETRIKLIRDEIKDLSGEEQ